jgi:chorismate dehydratase
VNKIRISAVSYTNTKPFLYGLQHSSIKDKIDLSLDMPSDCAQKLIDDVVDIGLIPVAATLSLPQWEIVSAYCIGAVGAVNSVFIFSNCDIKDVKLYSLIRNRAHQITWGVYSLKIIGKYTPSNY